MKPIEEHWNWGPAWRALRDDVNLLAWLFEEERIIQRLYLESAIWAISGLRYRVDEFAADVGFGDPGESPTHDSERSEAGSLEPGSGGEV